MQCNGNTIDGIETPIYLPAVNAEIEPFQQRVRKSVGRRRTERQTLLCVEELAAFVRKYAPGVFQRVEGDFFEVRKAVGRPRSGQG
jgi:hypothetical protein